MNPEGIHRYFTRRFRLTTIHPVIYTIQPIPVLSRLPGR